MDNGNKNAVMQKSGVHNVIALADDCVVESMSKSDAEDSFQAPLIEQKFIKKKVAKKEVQIISKINKKRVPLHPFQAPEEEEKIPYTSQMRRKDDLKQFLARFSNENED